MQLTPPIFCSLYYVIEHSEIISFMFKMLALGSPACLQMCAPWCHAIGSTLCSISSCNKRSGFFSEVSDGLWSSVVACVPANVPAAGLRAAGECRCEHLDCLAWSPLCSSPAVDRGQGIGTTHVSVPFPVKQKVTGMSQGCHEAHMRGCLLRPWKKA